ncbi:Hypothetical predicted protein [Paramuricea clavata]|uniref:Uncharacterized protein n=1 Tax=Paramuricea clavata TaxID=317549 RepID=A0A6S7FNI6_PARCT|nr:Hypothetical predicted protein [Paramuricea clavata]
MYKAERSKVEEVYVVGLEVDYIGSISGLPSGRTNIRCLILLWTGDYPAQCEVKKIVVLVLHRLHKLYELDVIRDTVFDMMHHLPLNVVRKHVKRVMDEGIVDKNVSENKLSLMPWTAGCHESGLMDEREFHIFQLMARMVEMVFNKRDEWDHDDVFLFGKLAKRFNILIEENVGLHACVVTAHNLIHVEEDVFRFSLPDNYWCFAFERAVKKYISIPNNHKNIECSFAKKEQRREFLKSLNTEEAPLPHAAKIDVDKVKNALNISTVLQFLALVIIGDVVYPRPADDMDTIAVVDFERPNLPINFADITVPFYPMVNDIVVIRGENDEIWVAKILKVYTEEKTVKVWYYREQGHELFVPEVSSRDALDIVNWDSIVHLAPEEWIDGGS